MNKLFSLLLFISFSISLDAQDNENNKVPDAFEMATPKERGYAYPIFKPLTISYDRFGKSKYTADYLDKRFEDGKLTSNYRFNASAHFPFFANKKWVVSGSINYLHEEFKLADVNTLNNIPHQNSLSVDDASVTVNTIFRNTLFNKPIIYNANIILDSRDLASVQRIRGMLGATIILKRTASSAISTGLIGFIDPSVQIPVFPTFSYWHKFSNSNWEFDAILPAKLMFRRSNTFNGWLSLGTELKGNSFFNQNEIQQLPGNYETSYSELWAGLTYEYPINKFLLAGLKSGIKNTITSRMGKVNAKRKDYILESSPKPAPYISLSLSVMMPKKK